jgi:hypothetical protein
MKFDSQNLKGKYLVLKKLLDAEWIRKVSQIRLEKLKIEFLVCMT